MCTDDHDAHRKLRRCIPEQPSKGSPVCLVQLRSSEQQLLERSLPSDSNGVTSVGSICSSNGDETPTWASNSSTPRLSYGSAAAALDTSAENPQAANLFLQLHQALLLNQPHKGQRKSHVPKEPNSRKSGKYGAKGSGSMQNDDCISQCTSSCGQPRPPGPVPPSGSGTSKEMDIRVNDDNRSRCPIIPPGYFGTASGGSNVVREKKGPVQHRKQANSSEREFKATTSGRKRHPQLSETFPDYKSAIQPSSISIVQFVAVAPQGLMQRQDRANANVEEKANANAKADSPTSTKEGGSGRFKLRLTERIVHEETVTNSEGKMWNIEQKLKEEASLKDKATNRISKSIPNSQTAIQTSLDPTKQFASSSVVKPPVNRTEAKGKAKAKSKVNSLACSKIGSGCSAFQLPDRLAAKSKATDGIEGQMVPHCPSPIQMSPRYIVPLTAWPGPGPDPNNPGCARAIAKEKKNWKDLASSPVSIVTASSHSASQIPNPAAHKVKVTDEILGAFPDIRHSFFTRICSMELPVARLIRMMKELKATRVEAYSLLYLQMANSIIAQAMKALFDSCNGPMQDMLMDVTAELLGQLVKAQVLPDTHHQIALRYFSDIIAKRAAIPSKQCMPRKASIMQDIKASCTPQDSVTAPLGSTIDQVESFGRQPFIRVQPATWAPLSGDDGHLAQRRQAQEHQVAAEAPYRYKQRPPRSLHLSIDYLEVDMDSLVFQLAPGDIQERHLVSRARPSFEQCSDEEERALWKLMA